MEILNKDIIQWDVRTWSKAIVFWENAKFFPDNGIGLELGGREGGLSLWLAEKGMSVVCSDLENTEPTARPLHDKHSISNQITYTDIDALKIPFENHFDVIVFKSIIGGIGRDGHKERQQKVFDEIYKALKPGGQLLFAENLSSSALHRWMRKKFVRWGDSWRYVNLNEIEEFLKQFQEVKMKSTGFMSAFGRSEGQRNFLAVTDELIFNHITTDRMKYVVFVSAMKSL